MTATVTLDVSSIMSACKELLTQEWAAHKKTGKLNRHPVCRYSVGGPRDNPVAVLPSVAKGFNNIELLLRDIVDCKKPEGSPLLDGEVVVGGDCSVSVYPPRHTKDEAPHTSAYTITTTPAPSAGTVMCSLLWGEERLSGSLTRVGP